MFNIAHLIGLAEGYAKLTGVELKTVSSRVFADSKKVAALKSGSDITVGRFNAAVHWFAAHWPDGEDWPDGIDRPACPVLQEAAE